MNDTLPIFIGGIPRSGTGMMRRFMGSHSQIAMPPREFEFFKKDFNPRDTIQSQEELMALVRQILSWGKVQDWALDEGKVLEAARHTAPGYQELFMLFLEQYRQKAGKSRCGEKTTEYEQHVDILDDWFGHQYRFIQMIRNPIHVFASISWYKGKKRYLNASVWAAEWVKSATVGLQRSRKMPEVYRLVRYEDVVADTEPILKGLCEFVGVEFEPENMLAMSEFQKKDTSSFARQIEQSTYQKNVRKRDNVDRLSLLSDLDVAIIRAKCGSLAELLGYDIGQKDIEPSAYALAGLHHLSLRQLFQVPLKYIPGRIIFSIKQQLNKS